MNSKPVIILCMFAIMVIAGIYTFRFLNDKLRSSRSTGGLIFYALSLFIAMGSIYFGGLFAIAWLYDYLSG